MDNIDLKYIKKHYGENFAKLCRDSFPTILEKEGHLTYIITKLFSPSKNLYTDIATNNLKHDFISYVNYEAEKVFPNSVYAKASSHNESPFDLMKKAGYTLYHCKTNRDIQCFKKYYKRDEAICTFIDPTRLYEHLVFFAVKDNASKLNRRDFTNPKREDEYGTSVISIQFSKGTTNNVSIKNRYNHTVANPDATFSNNLENIIPGLTESFEKHFNLKLKPESSLLSIPNYIRDKDGKLYPVNHKTNDGFICQNNIIIKNGKAEYFDKNKYEIIDYFLIDKENATITNLLDYHDSFIDSYKNIKKINISYNEDGTRNFDIITSNDKKSTLLVNNQNQIVGYSNENLENVGDDFLNECHSISKVNLPNLKTTGNSFMRLNTKLNYLSLPNLEIAGNGFLANNCNLASFNAPKLKKVENAFMLWNTKLKTLELPSLEYIGRDFLQQNKILSNLYTPNLIESSENILISHPKQKKFIHSINKTINSNLKTKSYRQKSNSENHNNYELQ